MPSLPGLHGRPGQSARAARYHVWDDTGRPIEPLDASTLEGAVAEAREMAAETALEDACCTGDESGQNWIVYSLGGGGEGEGGANGGGCKYVREASGVERADPERVACMLRGVPAAPRPGAAAQPALQEA